MVCLWSLSPCCTHNHAMRYNVLKMWSDLVYYQSLYYFHFYRHYSSAAWFSHVISKISIPTPDWSHKVSLGDTFQVKIFLSQFCWIMSHHSHANHEIIYVVTLFATFFVIMSHLVGRAIIAMQLSHIYVHNHFGRCYEGELKGVADVLKIRLGQLWFFFPWWDWYLTCPCYILFPWKFVFYQMSVKFDVMGKMPINWCNESLADKLSDSDVR